MNERLFRSVKKRGFGAGIYSYGSASITAMGLCISNMRYDEYRRYYFSLLVFVVETTHG